MVPISPRRKSHSSSSYEWLSVPLCRVAPEGIRLGVEVGGNNVHWGQWSWSLAFELVLSAVGLEMGKRIPLGQ